MNLFIKKFNFYLLFFVITSFPFQVKAGISFQYKAVQGIDKDKADSLIKNYPKNIVFGDGLLLYSDKNLLYIKADQIYETNIIGEISIVQSEKFTFLLNNDSVYLMDPDKFGKINLKLFAILHDTFKTKKQLLQIVKINNKFIANISGHIYFHQNDTFYFMGQSRIVRLYYSNDTLFGLSFNKKIALDYLTNKTTLFSLSRSFLAKFWLSIILLLILLVVVVFLLMRLNMWVFINKKQYIEQIVNDRTEILLREKEKTEQLLANLLPKSTADELKTTGKATSQKFSMVTVLFSDIQGFTRIAEHLNPDMLIDQLDAFFFHFDSVVEKYNIEKIKTIGDAYMCAGGIPDKNITNPVEVVLAALEMQEYMKELKSKDSAIWDLRIGIHTGSVIAGVVGHKKMSYDIWGDTVNVASRMESSGEIGKINISGQTLDHVKEFFICEHRGKMPVKYKGEIDMYFVKGIRPELAVDMKHIPNKKFFVLLQLLRIQDIEEMIFENMEKEWPENLYFNNIKRVREIYTLTELLCRAEELSDEESLLVRTAALFKYSGYSRDYDNYIEHSKEFALFELPRYRYSEEQIKKIISLIECGINSAPANMPESILADAELNYLTRADFPKLSVTYYNELLEKNKVQTFDEWIDRQSSLLSSYNCYTKTALALREVMPEEQIKNLRAYKINSEL